MKLELPYKYSQMDSRWGNIFLGFNTQLPYNLYNYGCLETCLAMIARYYKKNYDPASLNEALKSMGAGKAFKANSGEYVWGGFSLLFGDIEEKHTRTPDLLTDAQINEIKTAIDSGYPVMVHLDYNPKTVANDMHFVLIVGYNPNEENDFTIIDPLGGEEKSLKSYLGWYKPNARNTIEQYAIYKGPVPKIPSGTIPVEKKVFEEIVHGSTEWDKTVNEYKPGNNPKQTQFEEIRNVVNGYKSRATDLEGKLTLANAEIKNREEQVARKEAECQASEKLRKDLTDKLNDALKGSANVVGVYEGQLKDKQRVIDEQGEIIGDLKKQLATAQADLKKVKYGSTTNLSVYDILVKIVNKLLPFLQKTKI